MAARCPFGPPLYNVSPIIILPLKYVPDAKITVLVRKTSFVSVTIPVIFLFSIRIFSTKICFISRLLVFSQTSFITT